MARAPHGGRHACEPWSQRPRRRRQRSCRVEDLRSAAASAPGHARAQITGDNVLIARETAAALGMGARIRTPEGLPALPPDGRVPRDLGKTLAPLVLACDGFAQARRAPAL
jgi:hypothetical protein